MLTSNLFINQRQKSTLMWVSQCDYLNNLNGLSQQLCQCHPQRKTWLLLYLFPTHTKHIEDMDAICETSRTDHCTLSSKHTRIITWRKHGSSGRDGAGANASLSQVIVPQLPVFRQYRCFHATLRAAVRFFNLVLYPWICDWTYVASFAYFILFVTVITYHIITPYLYLKPKKKKPPSAASKVWVPEETWPVDHQNEGSRGLAQMRRYDEWVQGTRANAMYLTIRHSSCL